ncbi:MAG: thioesterase family protein [Polyangiaceae bacterium]
MIRYRRPVRFEDVDAAQIVFFGRFFGYCHEAMEVFFDELAGGYAGLIVGRKIGFPAVHVEADFKSPLRYGDTARISVDVTKVGNKSATLRFTIANETGDALVAVILHTCAVSDLVALKAIAIPDDVRKILEAHLVSA